jgi:hypothetical protein
MPVPATVIEYRIAQLLTDLVKILRVCPEQVLIMIIKAVAVDMYYHPVDNRPGIMNKGLCNYTMHVTKLPPYPA